MNFFDILSGVLTKNKSKEYFLEHIEFNKAFSPFMLVRYLSMRSDLLLYARVINHFNTTALDAKSVFTFAYDHIPKQKNGYIAYMKKSKKTK